MMDSRHIRRGAAVVGGWVQTASGKRLWPLSPCEGEVELGDIAHHLAQLSRFGGAAPQPYSVAHHSVLVSERAEQLAVGRGVEPELAITIALQGLLHDAPEFVLGDITRPLKAGLAVPELGVELEDLEAAWMGCILRRFHLPESLHPFVLQADEDVLATEVEVLFPASQRPAQWLLMGEIQPSLERSIREPLGFHAARMAFLLHFRSLGGRA